MEVMRKEKVTGRESTSKIDAREDLDGLHEEVQLIQHRLTQPTDRCAVGKLLGWGRQLANL